MATEVDAAVDEITGELERIAPIHEGLKDFSRLNLQAETVPVVAAAIEDYDRRVSLLVVAKKALEALQMDGHPELQKREIPAAALADLLDNTATVDAAITIFASGEAKAMTLKPGVVEDK